MDTTLERTIPTPQLLGSLFSAAGIAVVIAPHLQIDKPLFHSVLALTTADESIAVIVADNQFDADTLARRIDQGRLKVARGETPHQVRTLVRRLYATRFTYSAVIVIGLLEPFYDEGVKWAVASHLLADTLQVLQELSQTIRVLVLAAPTLIVSRPYLKQQLVQAAAVCVELPALESAVPALQERLF